MSRNHQVSGHFIKKIKICLQVINKKLFSDITKHNVSLRRGSGALSTVCSAYLMVRRSACRKKQFSTSCETVENVPEFRFLSSVAVQKYRSEKKTKNANVPKSSGFGAFH